MFAASLSAPGALMQVPARRDAALGCAAIVAKAGHKPSSDKKRFGQSKGQSAPPPPYLQAECEEHKFGGAVDFECVILAPNTLADEPSPLIEVSCRKCEWKGAKGRSAGQSYWLCTARNTPCPPCSIIWRYLVAPKLTRGRPPSGRLPAPLTCRADDARRHPGARAFLVSAILLWR